MAARRLVESVLHVIRSHWYGTAVATVGSLVFFWASLYETEIRGAFPIAYRGPYDDISWPAVVFWIGLLIVTAMLAFKNKADDDARNELIEATKQVQVLVQTLPPKGWREDFATAANATALSLNAVLPRRMEGDTSLEEVQKATVVLLSSIASLALKYDGQPRTPDGALALYAANIMVFMPSQNAEPIIDLEAAKVLRFVPEDFDRRQLLGVLRLIPALSYSTVDDGLDKALSDLALPVPRVTKSPDGRWKVLPGAPLAFVGDGVDGYADTRSIGKWFDDAADFPRSVRDDVASYFSGIGNVSRSFVSRRLLSGSDGIGVLNLHCNLPNLLGVREGGSAEASVARREEFFALMTPFIRDLQAAVQLYRGTGG